MKLALRGIMDRDGDIHSWPMLAMSHSQFFGKLSGIDRDARVRWRQWKPGGEIDFDPGATPADRDAVVTYVRRANSTSQR